MRTDDDESTGSNLTLKQSSSIVNRINVGNLRATENPEAWTVL
jgi:hypothetical protein